MGSRQARGHRVERSAPTVAPGSSLHRMMGLTPGYAPVWLCGRSRCIGLDIPSMVPGALFLAACAASRWWAWLSFLALTILYWALVYEPFAGREQWGRARRRRGECVWCGQDGVASYSVCAACGRRA